MKQPETSTAHTRELGHELQQVRKRNGYSGADMSRMLGWGFPKVSRLESGQRSVPPGDVAIYLARARATPEELEDLVALASEPHGHQLQFHSPGLPDQLRTLTLLEAHSVAITTYSPKVIPALLQTEPYIRAVLRRCGYTGPDLESGVEARLARHSLFNRRSRPLLNFYIHENVLNAVVGDSTVMNEQLVQLQLASSLPQCHIHVVPATAEEPGDGPEFSVFQHEGNQPVFHVDAFTASLFLEEDSVIAYYQEFLRRLTTTALDRDQSRNWIVNRTGELEQNTPGDMRQRTEVFTLLTGSAHSRNGEDPAA
ncbi:helix-turn-helix transcriptional regulator [Amycolatopsis sp. EV170708-02-1]|uniref:helix-turn-helix domain-containing protein n=1 Tax=Amycolatopsis sp. EV170708-02-1 TaxID=2919322 RepID=UPI001F0BAE40|nr:helix-turn-helix transcriptional regulator [Amycolatopsis sp. EV170708-02-1]UMP04376.1 helix-turn-helix domain-containing protein [Amycolatopsis sp. EV170708-02-1]UMP07177.1 helix-turn-helix domain-containing protein [Amycolatopsis sp. EV170708-02-1]